MGLGDSSDCRDVDCDRLDPASMALMERLNYVVSLLENQPSHSVESGPVVSPETNNTNTVSPWPVAQHDHPQVSSQALSHCNLSCRVLQWPILHNESYDAVLESMFVSEKEDLTSRSSRPRGVVEEEFPAHVRSFLANVHTKNPVVEHKTLIQYANDFAENDISWDGPSCLVVRPANTLHTFASMLTFIATDFGAGHYLDNISACSNVTAGSTRIR